VDELFQVPLERLQLGVHVLLEVLVLSVDGVTLVVASSRRDISRHRGH
jgi:hypothetical protein